MSNPKTDPDPEKKAPDPAEPWAKTSSGDKEKVLEDDDSGDDLLDQPPLPGPGG